MIPLLLGYATGLSLVILVGPVLLVLLTNTLGRGPKAGLLVALGIFVSDILAVALTLVGIGALMEQPHFKRTVALLGAIVLLGMGIRYLIAPGLRKAGKISTSTLTGAFVQGFLVNFVNPFVFMVWIGIITAARATWGTTGSLYLYVSGTLLGILTLDLLKVVLAGHLAPFLRRRGFIVLRRVSGGALILFSVRLLVAI